MQSVEVCSTCFSPRISPFIGFEAGKVFKCEDCNSISPVTIEFESIEALVDFLQARQDAEE